MSRIVAKLIALLCLIGPNQPLNAQSADTLVLTLSEALNRAVSVSEEVRLAEAQIDLADAQVREAYSPLYPQISGSAGYTRTIESVFDSGESARLPDSLQFDPDPTTSLEERVRYLEDNVPNAAFSALTALFSDLPFGQENTYVFSVSGSQVLYAPQAGAGIDIARHFRQATHYNFTEEQAEIRLQVEQAYIQAILAGELEIISEAALAQAAAFLEEERLRLRAGRASDLEVLRAEVELENMRPPLIQAQNARAVAVLNLKRLTNIPYDQPVAFATPLTLPPEEQLAASELDPETVLSGRAAIRAAQEQVEIREAQVRLKRASYLPRVAATANYGRQLFTDTIFNLGGGWRPDFTIGLGVQVSIFSGFQREAAVEQAQVELSRARHQLVQLREGVLLQLKQARGEKERARSLIAARQRTVAQAMEVYRLTNLQYEQGVTTQLAVSDARLALLQARSNLVQALADFYLAEADLARARATPADTSTPITIPQGVIPERGESLMPGSLELAPSDSNGYR